MIKINRNAWIMTLVIGLSMANIQAADITHEAVSNDGVSDLEIRWTGKEESFWKGKKADFIVSGEKTNNNAMFWVAVDKEGILIHSEITDDSHQGGRNGKTLWRGDSIQLAFDSLNNGLEIPPKPLDIDKEIEKQYPKGMKLSSKDKSNKKKLISVLKRKNKGIGRQKNILPDDADYGFGLSEKNTQLGYSFYHGRLGYSGKKNFANVVRDESKKITTYDIKIPWSDFNMSSLISPKFRMSIQINDADKDENGKKSKGKYQWGTGIGGIFMPSYFKRIIVKGIPENHSAIYLYKNEFLNSNDSIELYTYNNKGEYSVEINNTKLKFESKGSPFYNKLSYKTDKLPNRVEEYKFSIGGRESFCANVFNESKELWYAFDSKDALKTDSRGRYQPFNEAEAAINLKRGERFKKYWGTYKGKGKEYNNSDWLPIIKYDIDSKTCDDISKIYDNSVIDMSGWLDAPAGKFGTILLKGDHFEFENGKKIKFWGAQQTYGNNAMNKTLAVAMARKCSKYGVNIMRFHKFSYFGNGIGSQNDNQYFDEEKIDKMDFYANELKKRGVYYGFSTFFGHNIHPSFADKLKHPEEIIKIDKRGKIRSGTLGIVNVAEDIQDLLIDWQIKILNHKNPYTGMKYAEDPALAFVEMHNEDDIFWGATASAMNKCPKYALDFAGIFSDWLKKKYGSHEGLVKAWGETALSNKEKETGYYFFQKKISDEDEHLDKRNIFAICNPWFFSKFAFEDQEKNPKIKGKARLLDNMRFLYEFQNRFYKRYAKAIRDTGYKGPLISSCWQAGSDASHFLNLHSDALIGVIDRHNYHGGQSGFSAHKGALTNIPMVSEPGYSVLSSGMQQVAGRPFALSEWAGNSPYEWMADATALVAVYGMGLQGWDTSCQFQWPGPNFTNTINPKWGVNSPLGLGTYPALSRMVLREDVTESEAVSNRNVCIQKVLETGNINFEEKMFQIHDEKVIGGKEVPHQSMAVGKVLVNYTEEDLPTETLDLSKYTKDGVIRSVTDELAWKSGIGMEGYFTVDTKGTKAVVGFAPNKKFQLGNVAITLKNRFATLFITSLDRDKDLSNCQRILIQSVARGYNSGMEYNLSHNAVLKLGQGPVIMEPVVAEINFGKIVKNAEVNILDYDGRRTGRTLEIKNSILSIDGAKDKAMYYEVIIK